jgi:DNA-directed RNA polymerase subunit RPC12/RpoP
MTSKKRRITAWEWSCVCERCGHAWTTIRVTEPEQCPSCGARAWNRPARPYKRRTVKIYDDVGLQPRAAAKEVKRRLRALAGRGEVNLTRDGIDVWAEKPLRTPLFLWTDPRQVTTSIPVSG